MVIENPMPEEKKKILKKDLEELTNNNVYISNISRADSSVFDYIVEFQEDTKYKMRTVLCKVKWHSNKEEWEVKITSKGEWMS